MEDTELVEGLALDQKSAGISGPKRMEKAKIGLIQFCISPPKTDVSDVLVGILNLYCSYICFFISPRFAIGRFILNTQTDKVMYFWQFQIQNQFFYYRTNSLFSCHILVILVNCADPF